MDQRDAATDQRWIGEVTDAGSNIKALLDQIDHVVVQPPSDRHIGLSRQVTEARRHPRPLQRNRCGRVLTAERAPAS
jgi:hypothetical protein